MLYGTKEMIDGRVGSLLTSADTVEEFVAFTGAVVGQEENRNWVETYASMMLDHMQNPTFKGFKHSVLAVYHEDEAQRDAFWTEWSLQELMSQPARDRHLDMLHNKREEIRQATETPEQKAMTIEERYGLDKEDRWDKRSEEEVEADNKVKQQMKEMRQKGELSGDSFGGADSQRASRDRPNADNVPGAYGRTQAQEAIKTFEPDLDTDALTNDQLGEKLKEMGVPDLTGVYDDDAVPKKAKGNGTVQIEDIRGSRNEDGTLDIDEILAHKFGGEVDEVQKAANEAAHNEKVAQAKQGRKAFSPEDFAAVLRGDGSADAVTHEVGDNRMTRQASSPRPSLSDAAEAARQEHQENERKEMKRRRTQAEKEQDVKARGDRDRGVFKGADLVHDDDATAWDDLPENVRETLDQMGIKRDEILVKNYPYNSELGGRAILPFDGLQTSEGMRYVGGVNLTTEGTMTMGAPGVAIVSRTDSKEDGYGIYARKRMPRAKASTLADMVTPSEEGEPNEPRIDVYLVKVRAN
jgi:hypothetical protein